MINTPTDTLRPAPHASLCAAVFSVIAIVLTTVTACAQTDTSPRLTSTQIKRLEERVRTDPNDVGAIAALAADATRRHDWPNAIECWRSVVKLEPSPKRYISLINALGAADRRMEQLAVYEEFLAKHPSLKQTHALDIMGIYAALRATNKLDQTANSYLSSAGTNKVDWICLARHFETAGLTNRANDCYLKASGDTLSDDEHYAALSALVSRHTSAGEFDKACDFIDKMIGMPPPSHKRGWHVGMDLCALVDRWSKEGGSTKAIETGRKYLSRVPAESVPSLNRCLAEISIQAGRTNDAIAFYRAAVGAAETFTNRPPSTVQLYGEPSAVFLDPQRHRDEWTLKIADMLRHNAEYDNALQEIRLVLARTVRESIFFQAVQTGISTMESTDKSADYLKNAEQELKKSPGNIALLKYAFVIYCHAKEFRKASDALHSATRLSPSSFNYRIWIASFGDRYMASPADEIDAWNEFFKAFPSSRRSQITGVLRAYQRAGKTEAMVEMAKDIAYERSTSYYTRTSIARELHRAGCVSAAIDILKKAIKESGAGDRSISASRDTLDLAQWYYDSRLFVEARSTLKELVSSAPDSSTRKSADALLSTIDRIAEREGFVREVRARADASPADFDAQREAADACRVLKWHKEAAEYYKRALAIRDETWVHADLGAMLRASNQPPEALAAYRAYFSKAELPTERDTAAKAIIEILQAMGEPQQALEFLQEVEPRTDAEVIRTWMKQMIAALKEQIGRN